MNSLKAFIILLLDSRKYPLTGGERIAIFWNLCMLHLKSKFAKASGDNVTQRLHSFLVYAYDYPSLINLYTEIFLKQVYFAHLNSSKPIIIDCGANIGLSTLFFKKCYPESVIWAFEPNPNSFHLLKKNVLQNHLQDVTLFNCALSFTDGEAPFFVPLKNSSVNGSFVPGLSESYEARVETRKLSDFIDLKIDFIKMDIEGSEVAVIQDLVKHDSLSSINEFIIEYHQKLSPTTLHEFLSYFKNSNFAYRVVGEDIDRNIILNFYKEPGLL